jgi:hypothetical protein
MEWWSDGLMGEIMACQSGTKCPQTLPLRAALLLCKSELVKKRGLTNYCPKRLTLPTGPTSLHQGGNPQLSALNIPSNPINFNVTGNLR